MEPKKLKRIRTIRLSVDHRIELLERFDAVISEMRADPDWAEYRLPTRTSCNEKSLEDFCDRHERKPWKPWDF